GTARTFYLLYTIIHTHILSLYDNILIHVYALSTCPHQQIILAPQQAIREVTREGIEDARPNRRAFHAKIVTMQQVVRGHVIQPAHRIGPPILCQHAPDHKIRHHASHVPQEFRHAHRLPWL